MQHENSPVDGEPGLDNLDAVFSATLVATRLPAAAPTAHAAAENFWQAAFSPSALSARMKELVLVALHATVTALDFEGVRRHVGRALTVGASQQDVLDVLITIVGAANHALYFAVPDLMMELQASSMCFISPLLRGWTGTSWAPRQCSEHQQPRALIAEAALQEVLALLQSAAKSIASSGTQHC